MHVIGAADRAIRLSQVQAVQPHLDRRGPVHDVGGQLDPGPQPAEPRQRDAVQAQVQDVLRIGRGQHRHADLGHGHLGAARHGRGFRDGIVAHQDQHTPGGVRAAEVAVPQCVGRPVQPGGLAVPDPDDPVAGLVRRRRRELGALDGVGAQLLVDGGPEHHRAALQELPLAPDLQVIPRERGPLVTGDEGGRGQAVPLVELMLIDRDPDQRLQPG